jgi:superfamily II DNA or RNA helicase
MSAELSVPLGTVPGMRVEVLVEVDAAGLRDAVGAGAYERGLQLLRRGAVERAVWGHAADVLLGMVRGSQGDLYATTARFTGGDGPARRFESGGCSCPVEYDCKHVVALVLDVATAGGVRAGGERAGRGSGAGAAAPGVGARGAVVEPGAGGGGALAEAGQRWQRSLDSLLAPDGSWRAAGADVPLAIELSLADPPGRTATHWAPKLIAGPGPAPRLLARVVRQGRNGWVGGGLSWAGLDTLRYQGAHPPAQVQLLQEMYALHRAAGGAHSYHYYGEAKALDLAKFESAQLWPLLDRAAEVGLALVHPRKRLGEFAPPATARLCLDITRDGESGQLAVAPAVQIGGAAADVVPLVFLGTQGHGLAYVERADLAGGEPGAWPLRLARLAAPVPPPLQRMALEQQRVAVPDAGLDRFREGYYPRLRRMAPVLSSDGSFEPPQIPDPTPVLLARYAPGHALELRWEWAYRVGDARLRAPLGPADDAGFRDPAAERRLLADLTGPLAEIGLPAVPADGADRLWLHLSGADTMRFSTEALPRLQALPGVAVQVEGEPADYREVGDSLRIGVAADAVAGETDWFDLGVTISAEGRQVPFATVFIALSRDEPYLLLDDGAYFSLEKPELQALRRLIEEARALQDAPPGQLRISRFQAGLWDELSRLGVVDRQAREWQQQVATLRALESVEPAPHPAGLAATLRPYQAEGFGWLAFLWEHRLGGILADDMGLGKTLQSLALICHARQADPDTAPFLIVAPTSVVSNWVAEAARFTPELSVVAITDTLRRRGQSLPEVIAGAHVVVTTYTLLRLDIDAYSASPWAGLLLDEAQHVKNHQSKAYQCVRRLPAAFKLALTGTPMENNLMELWALLSVGAPGLFPSPDRFRDYYARPIEKGDTELLAQLRRRIRPLVRRRTKEQVAADLPAKQEQVLELELHPRHRAIYQRHLQRERQKVLGLIGDLNRNRFTILRSLTLLRQLSLHAGLIEDDHSDVPSVKIDALLEQLADVTGSGHRALVFSQFTGFLSAVRHRLDAAGVDYCYLDGRTRNRPAVIERFKGGSVPVFLISLKAGGFGLNLTEADYCFLLDPWWNPATEAQAVDRTHRIGQTRNVMVYRLIARDTIEEKVMALKARKAALFASVMDDGNAFGAALSADDIRGLFT